jgi:hypothetical protein
MFLFYMSIPKAEQRFLASSAGGLNCTLTTWERRSVKASRADGGGGSHHGAPAAAAAAPAAPGEFSASFELLRKEVRKACSRHTRWESRVSAGIQAALEFAAANPARAQALVIDGRGDRQEEVIEHFTEMLGDVAPSDRFPISTDRAIVGSIATIVRSHLLADSAGQLPRLAPDLVYLALMPYVGLVGARQGAETAALLSVVGR